MNELTVAQRIADGALPEFAAIRRQLVLGDPHQRRRLRVA